MTSIDARAGTAPDAHVPDAHASEVPVPASSGELT